MSSRLVYFNGMGRAEMCRMLIWHSKTTEVEIQDLKKGEFGPLKQSGALRNGQLPVLFVGDKCLNESFAILRYLGRKLGYYPEGNLMDAWLIDATIDFISAEIVKITPLIF